MSTGRCGSTFLSAILSQAGADFGLAPDTNWNPASGTYEHPDLDRAYKWHETARTLHREIWPFNTMSRWCRQRRDTLLRRIFNDVNFAKTTQLVHLVQPIHQLEYELRIILIYRSFNGFAVSRYRRHGWTLPRIVETYCTVNRTALLQLHTFGGYAISYEELTSKDETAWAESLQELTDISKNDLLSNRERLLRDSRHQPISPILNREAQELYDELRKRKGKIIPPAVEQ